MRDQVSLLTSSELLCIINEVVDVEYLIGAAVVVWRSWDLIADLISVEPM